MRLLDRNKQTVYYRNFQSAAEITMAGPGGETLYTGERDGAFTEIKSVEAYVKSSVGNSNTEPFGDFNSNRRTMYVDDDNCDIGELSELWVGIDPAADEEGTPTVAHNFVVKGIADGINHRRIAIERVTVSD